MARRNEARRLISLIDALYECHTKVYCSMEIVPELLFVDVGDAEHDRFEIMHGEMLGEMLYDMGAEQAEKGDIYKHTLFTGEEEVFASQRCISRLHEMRSAAYWSLPHDGAAGLTAIDASALQLEEAEAEGGSGGDSQRVSDPLRDTRDKPRFSAKHFWGAGWCVRGKNRGGGGRRGGRMGSWVSGVLTRPVPPLSKRWEKIRERAKGGGGEQKAQAGRRREPSMLE